MIIKELIDKFGDESENWLILEFLTKRKINELKLNYLLNIDDIYNEFLDIKHMREKSYPLQYIFGKWEFYGLELLVDESALIPRFETEILVDEILNLNCKKERILDIGCGSGAISLALAENLQFSKVFGIDISEKAVELSKKNKKKLGIRNVKFILSDMFSNLDEKKFDIIVSNPPYIDKEDMKTLAKELSFEPQNALYGGEDGLYFYKEIIKKANDYLNESGIIAFEIGYNQNDAVCDLLKNENFDIILTKKDFSGFDRIIIAKKGVMSVD